MGLALDGCFSSVSSLIEIFISFSLKKCDVQSTLCCLIHMKSYSITPINLKSSEFVNNSAFSCALYRLLLWLTINTDY